MHGIRVRPPRGSAARRAAPVALLTAAGCIFGVDPVSDLPADAGLDAAVDAGASLSCAPEPLLFDRFDDQTVAAAWRQEVSGTASATELDGEGLSLSFEGVSRVAYESIELYDLSEGGVLVDINPTNQVDSFSLIRLVANGTGSESDPDYVQIGSVGTERRWDGAGSLASPGGLMVVPGQVFDGLVRMRLAGGRLYFENWTGLETFETRGSVIVPNGTTMFEIRIEAGGLSATVPSDTAMVRRLSAKRAGPTGWCPVADEVFVLGPTDADLMSQFETWDVDGTIATGVEGVELSLTPSSIGHASLRSNARYDMRGGSLILDTDGTQLGEGEFVVSVIAASDEMFELSIKGSELTLSLEDDGGTIATSIAYDPFVDRFLRLTATETSVSFSTSSDGETWVLGAELATTNQALRSRELRMRTYSLAVGSGLPRSFLVRSLTSVAN